MNDTLHAGDHRSGIKTSLGARFFSSSRSSVSLPQGAAERLSLSQAPLVGGDAGRHECTTEMDKRDGMRRSFRGTRMLLSACRLWPHAVFLLMSAGGKLVQADLAAWARIMQVPAPDSLPRLLWTFVLFMTFTREFRNLFYQRCGKFSKLFAFLCPRLAGLDIECPSIGPGLFIQHGENTFVSARRIGANCWIGRHVVIGYSNDTDMPTLGENVRVYAGAKIIGKIEVGDNATIGLNTVVMGNVAPGTTVLGVPGRVIWSGAGRPPAALDGGTKG